MTEDLEEKIYFEKSKQDGLIRKQWHLLENAVWVGLERLLVVPGIKTVSGSKKFSAEFDQTVYPLDRGYNSVFLCTYSG